MKKKIFDFLTYKSTKLLQVPRKSIRPTFLNFTIIASIILIFFGGTSVFFSLTWVNVSSATKIYIILK